MPPRISREVKSPVLFPDTMDFQPRTSPCEIYCPAGNPIQKVHELLKEDRVEEALTCLRARNPLPGITGRVCSHPCERECNRRHYDEALSIRALERYAADNSDLSRVAGPKRMAGTGKKVAIIGSGPAGLSCAYFSALLGHDVTVLESAPLLGGIPRMAIPDFRLPKDVVDKEIGLILNLGVRARTNTAVGRDVRLGELRAEFDATLIATGRWRAKSLQLPGADSLLPGLDFLCGVNLGKRERIGETVVIIGGGGVAFNCAFTARRLGATRIHIVCLEADGSMCAFDQDVQRARTEGIQIHNSRMIARILERDGRIEGIEHGSAVASAFDAQGRLIGLPGGIDLEMLPADTVISAIGLEPDLGFLEEGIAAHASRGEMIEVEPESLMTPIPGIFAAGDVVSGSPTVAGAVGGGRRAAFAMDQYLHRERRTRTVCLSMSDGVLVTESTAQPVTPHVVAAEEIMNLDFFEKGERPPVVELETDGSVGSFKEIEQNLQKEAASREAARCFHCGHCTSCGCCVENCPGFVLAMDPQGPIVKYPDECWHCGCCRIACPSGAVLYEFPLHMLV